MPRAARGPPSSITASVTPTVPWKVYVLSSKSAGRTYVGIARDVRARLRQHNGLEPGGARSTRAGRPWRLRKTYGPYATRGEAQSVEHSVKRLRGPARLRWKPEPPPRAAGSA